MNTQPAEPSWNMIDEVGTLKREVRLIIEFLV